MEDCNVYNTTMGVQVKNTVKFKLFHRFEHG
jgi:hypothetical protein